MAWLAPLNAVASEPLTIVTNLPVGSFPDVVVRKYANILSQRLDRSVIVNNRPGASGAVALEHYITNVTDLHTIYIGDVVNFTSMPILYQKENLLTAIKPVMLMYKTPWVIVASSKFGSTQEIFNQYKKTPFFGSWAVGSPGQICGHEFSSILTSTAGEHVPYKELGAWFVDIINKNLVFSCTTIGSSQAYYQDNKIQYIAVTGNKRNPFYPNVPTVNEMFGTTTVTPDGWIGVFVKTSTDPAFAAMIEKEFLTISKSNDIKKLLESAMIVNTSAAGSAEFSKVLSMSINEYKYLIKKFNITIN